MPAAWAAGAIAGSQAPTISNAVRRLCQPLRLGLLDECTAEEERRTIAQLIGDAAALALIESASVALDIDWVRRYRLTAGGASLDP